MGHLNDLFQTKVSQYVIAPYSIIHVFILKQNSKFRHENWINYPYFLLWVIVSILEYASLCFSLAFRKRRVAYTYFCKFFSVNNMRHLFRSTSVGLYPFSYLHCHPLHVVEFPPFASVAGEWGPWSDTISRPQFSQSFWPRCYYVLSFGSRIAFWPPFSLL